MGMIRLKTILFGNGTTIGQGKELDGLGDLIGCSRHLYSETKQEEDKYYRERLKKHSLVRLLTEYE